MWMRKISPACWRHKRDSEATVRVTGGRGQSATWRSSGDYAVRGGRGDPRGRKSGGSSGADSPTWPARAEGQVEEPDGDGTGEQHGEAHGPYAGAKLLEYGAVDPGFESAQIAHEHHREAGAAPGVLVGDEVGLEDTAGEEGFIVLDAQNGHEGAARDEE